VPDDVSAEERSAPHLERRDALERQFLDRARGRTNGGVVFIALRPPTGDGIVTVQAPDGRGRCFPVFTTLARADDYARTAFGQGARPCYAGSDPLQIVAVLHAVRELASAEWFAVDRCPRCSVFSVTGIEAMKGPDHTISVWARAKATETARAELYFAHAGRLARSGRLYEARDLALETAGHVTFEHPGVHLLLGQLAVALGDGALRQEAAAFLEFFHYDAHRRKLAEVERSGSPDFAGP